VNAEKISPSRVGEKKIVSVSIPVLNEESNLQSLDIILKNIAEDLSEKYEFEFIYTDNNSDDRTWEILMQLGETDSRIRAYRFSKNIGFQNSILFNYKQTVGDVVIQIDADMQDPPELIFKFLEQWENGYKIVSGVRQNRAESYFMRKFRSAGYWFIDLISEHPIKRNTGDFRLMDRKVVDALINLRIPNPYLRGAISKLGVVEFDLPYSRNARISGTSKFNFRDIIKLGMNGISNHSNLPLKLANFVGISSLLLSLLGGIYYVTIKFMQPDLPRGYASLYILIVFGIGVNSLLLSVIGSYIRKIYFVLSGEVTEVIVAKIN
jgi:glycosyltransferase involved in cell wall biosynthesis